MLSAYTVTMCFDTPSITLCIYKFVLKLEFFIFPTIRYICLKEQTADASLHLLPASHTTPRFCCFPLFFLFTASPHFVTFASSLSVPDWYNRIFFRVSPSER